MSKQQHLLAALTLSTLTCHLPFRTGVFPVLGESFETLHSGIGVFERNFRTQHPPQGSRTHTRARGASRDWSNFPLRPTASRIHRHLTSPLPGDSEFRQMISTSCPLLGTSGREHPSWHTCHTPLQGVAGCFLCLCVCITPPAVYPLGVAQIPQHTNQLPNNQNHFTGSLVAFDLKQGVIPHKRARAFNPTAYYGLTRQDPRALSLPLLQQQQSVNARRRRRRCVPPAHTSSRCKDPARTNWPNPHRRFSVASRSGRESRARPNALSLACLGQRDILSRARRCVAAGAVSARKSPVAPATQQNT